MAENLTLPLSCWEKLCLEQRQPPLGFHGPRKKKHEVARSLTGIAGWEASRALVRIVKPTEILAINSLFSCEEQAHCISWWCYLFLVDKPSYASRCGSKNVCLGLNRGRRVSYLLKILVPMFIVPLSHKSQLYCTLEEGRDGRNVK